MTSHDINGGAAPAGARYRTGSGVAERTSMPNGISPCPYAMLWARRSYSARTRGDMADLVIAENRQMESRHGVSFRDAFWVWLRIALLSFGGPIGQIAVMHRILVDEKR